MVPGTIAILLVFIPAMLMALGVVREKELGSITNLYVTPVTRLEFLLGKQLPYISLSMISFFGLAAMAVFAFGVALKGSLLMLTVGALLYVTATTGLGLLMSTFTRSQVAAIFGTAIATTLPAIQFSGLTSPVSSLEGGAAVISQLYPMTYFLVIIRGTFNKALGFNVDATRMDQAFIGAGYIENIVTDEITRFVLGRRGASRLPIGLAVRVQFNPNLNGVWFGGVMEIVNNITMLSVIPAGAALIREREHGTIEHLLVMPLTPFQIMLAKVWANGLVVLVAAGLSLWFVVYGVLGMPIAGSVPLFLFAALLHLFSTTAMGILLATVARSMPQFALLMILVILPLQMLSGGNTPRESMPEFVQTIMLTAPTTHFVSLTQAVLFRGAGLTVVWPYLLAIVVIGAVFFAVALTRFRKSITLTQLLVQTTADRVLLIRPEGGRS